MVTLRACAGHAGTFGGIVMIALAVPIVILVLGTPLVLVVRLVLDIGRAL
jgi:hypothetical protein